MQLRSLLAIGVLILGSAATTRAWGQSAHFIKGPTASLDSQTGDYTVSFKEAGLGGTSITYTLTAQTETFTFQCFNHGGKTPQGSPNGVSFSNASQQTTLTPRNGQITGSVSLIPQLGDASCQGAGMVLYLIAVDFEGVVFSDYTNGISVDVPNLSASNLKIAY